jgi:hypothetical protein
MIITTYNLYQLGDMADQPQELSETSQQYSTLLNHTNFRKFSHNC